MTICKTTAALLTAAALVGGTTATFASETYVCDRTRLSTAGFQTPQGAKSFYMEKIGFRIDGDVVADSTFGPGVITPDGKRRLLTMDLADEQSNLAGAALKIRLFPDGRATVWVNPPSGYKVPSPSRYKCAQVR